MFYWLILSKFSCCRLHSRLTRFCTDDFSDVSGFWRRFDYYQILHAHFTGNYQIINFLVFARSVATRVDQRSLQILWIWKRFLMMILLFLINKKLKWFAIFFALSRPRSIFFFTFLLNYVFLFVYTGGMHSSVPGVLLKCYVWAEFS